MLKSNIKKEYNPPMSAQLPSGMKMYAELKRKCSVCKISKEISKFYKDKTESTGYSYKCKICKLAFNQAQAKKPSVKRYRKQYEFERGLRRNYGMKLIQYQSLYDSQQGKCALCGKHQDHCKRKLAVDHDHDTKEIRALLCDNCNPGIGYFKNSIEYLELAIKYLKKFQK